jgi:hypothetical protein
MPQLKLNVAANRSHFERNEQMKKFSHKTAFDYFGVQPRNYRWSWSARNDTSVVVTLWHDRFLCDDDGKLVYKAKMPIGEENKPGWRELVENLEFAQQHCGGKFKMILAVAEDVKAKPRRIRECWPDPDKTLKIRSFDAKTGGLIADVL